jgi:glycogen debranching enzyme
MEADGLIAAGVPGQQLTWMDARAGGREVTPRIGKPVEIQALWYNALGVAGRWSDRWEGVRERCQSSFAARFWNELRGCLYDVVDVDHVVGRSDPSLRPNQVLAIGGLPEALLRGDRAARTVGVVERELLTPLGLRTLAAGEPGFVPHYGGGPDQRDGAYHQGTVWPWLTGAFVDAWLRVRGRALAARREARQRFVQPLLDHLNDAGLGHVSEIADAVEPHTPAGCPFQAWSVGELLRMEAMTALDDADAAAPKRRKVVRT